MQCGKCGQMLKIPGAPAVRSEPAADAASLDSLLEEAAAYEDAVPAATAHPQPPRPPTRAMQAIPVAPPPTLQSGFEKSRNRQKKPHTTWDPPSFSWVFTTFFVTFVGLPIVAALVGLVGVLFGYGPGAFGLVPLSFFFAGIVGLPVVHLACSSYASRRGCLPGILVFFFFMDPFWLILTDSLRPRWAAVLMGSLMLLSVPGVALVLLAVAHSV